MRRANLPQDDQSQPGDLLRELESRQDDVLAQLDALDAQIQAVLQGCGVRMGEPEDPAWPATDEESP